MTQYLPTLGALALPPRQLAPCAYFMRFWRDRPASQGFTDSVGGSLDWESLWRALSYHAGAVNLRAHFIFRNERVCLLSVMSRADWEPDRVTAVVHQTNHPHSSAALQQDCVEELQRSWLELSDPTDRRQLCAVSVDGPPADILALAGQSERFEMMDLASHFTLASDGKSAFEGDFDF